MACARGMWHVACACGMCMCMSHLRFEVVEVRAPHATCHMPPRRHAATPPYPRARTPRAQVTGTFPYPRGRVRRLRDEPPPVEEPAADGEGGEGGEGGGEGGESAAAACARMEGEVIAAVRTLVELSAKIEAVGGAAEAAEEALLAPSLLLAAHDAAVMGGLYRDAAERWEVLSLGACDLVAMPHAAAVEALATRSASRRFEILLAHLQPAIAELAALTSLDSLDSLGGGGGGGGGGAAGLADVLGLGSAAGAGGATGAAVGPDARQSLLGGTTAFSPIDIPLGQPFPSAADAAGGAGGADVSLGEMLAGGLNSPSQEVKLAEGARVEFWCERPPVHTPSPFPPSASSHTVPMSTRTLVRAVTVASFPAPLPLAPTSSHLPLHTYLFTPTSSYLPLCNTPTSPHLPIHAGTTRSTAGSRRPSGGACAARRASCCTRSSLMWTRRGRTCRSCLATRAGAPSAREETRIMIYFINRYNIISFTTKYYKRISLNAYATAVSSVQYLNVNVN